MYVKDLYVFKNLYEADKVRDPSANGVVHTSNDKNLFLYVKSKTDYKIDVYDLDGNKSRIIRKNYPNLKKRNEK